MSEEKISELSFEKAMSELETIVRSLESGSAELESAIELYTKGITLKEHCESILKKAKLKIDKIIVGNDGKAEDLEAFE